MKPYYSRDGITLYHGDCRKIIPQLPVGFDATVTDPPYSIVNEFGTQHKLDGTRSLEFSWDREMTPEDVANATGLAMSRCHLKAGAFVFCGSDQVGFLIPVMRENGFTPKMAAWVKTCPPPALPGNWWPSGFELAFYGYRPGAWFGDEDPKRSNVFVSDTYRHGQPGKVNHPTQKPLRIMERIVSSVVPPGGSCIDPFNGSGSTGIACIRHGRGYVGIELSEEYCELSAKRFDSELDQPSLFPVEEAASTETQRDLFEVSADH